MHITILHKQGQNNLYFTTILLLGIYLLNIEIISPCHLTKKKKFLDAADVNLHVEKFWPNAQMETVCPMETNTIIWPLILLRWLEQLHQVMSLSELWALIVHTQLTIGLHMGTGKPTVFPKWVSQVWVQCLALAHHSTPHTYTAVSQVYTGKLQ